MCQAVCYALAGQGQRCHFAHARARLPVATRRGAQVILVPWGRRPGEPGQLPASGWARLTQIQAGLWDRFEPRPVQLPVTDFASRDTGGREQWFEVTKGQIMQGCLVRRGRERRVYVVTLDCAPGMTEFERWPRIVPSLGRSSLFAGIHL